MRIDKLLWFLRLAKTRSAAQALVGAGHVRLNGKRVERTAQAVATKISVLGRDPARARAPQFDGIPGWGPFLRWHSTI